MAETRLDIIVERLKRRSRDERGARYAKRGRTTPPAIIADVLDVIIEELEQADLGKK